MHVVDTFYQLIHIVLDSVFRQVVAFAFDSVIQVHVHQFKYQSQSSRGFVAK